MQYQIKNTMNMETNLYNEKFGQATNTSDKVMTALFITAVVAFVTAAIVIANVCVY